MERLADLGGGAPVLGAGPWFVLNYRCSWGKGGGFLALKGLDVGSSALLERQPDLSKTLVRVQ
jgi:hypothetical protein